jgi:hypothetical protein
MAIIASTESLVDAGLLLDLEPGFDFVLTGESTGVLGFRSIIATGAGWTSTTGEAFKLSELCLATEVCEIFSNLGGNGGLLVDDLGGNGATFVTEEVVRFLLPSTPLTPPINALPPPATSFGA